MEAKGRGLWAWESCVPGGHVALSWCPVPGPPTCRLLQRGSFLQRLPVLPAHIQETLPRFPSTGTFLPPAVSFLMGEAGLACLLAMAELGGGCRSHFWSSVTTGVVCPCVCACAARRGPAFSPSMGCWLPCCCSQGSSRVHSRRDVWRLAVLMSDPLEVLSVLEIAVCEKRASLFVCSFTSEPQKDKH